MKGAARAMARVIPPLETGFEHKNKHNNREMKIGARKNEQAYTCHPGWVGGEL